MKSKNLHVGISAWAPALLIAAGIFAASALPGATLPPPAIPHLDKAQHGLVYALLGAACARGLQGAGVAWSRAGVALAAAVIATVYGASDEFHQAFVPGRKPDVYDLIADGVGALLGGAMWVRKRRLPAERRS